MVLPNQADEQDPLNRIRVHCPLTGETRSGRQCNGCSRFLNWELSTTQGLSLICRLPCSSCAGRAEDEHPSEAVFCEDCSQARGDDVDLGGES